MKLAEIKSKLDINKFELRTSANEDGEDTGWLRHWDDIRRLSVSIPKDLAVEISKNPDESNLVLTYETRISKESERQYDSYRILKSEPVEMVL